MPYYRIVIWTKKRKAPYTGIRLIGDANINAVYQQMNQRAYETYRNDLINIEVQMLSKLCKAVKAFENNPPNLKQASIPLRSVFKRT